VLAMCGFALLALNAYQKQDYNFTIFFLVSTAIINPIFKVSLDRSAWNILDVIWAIILLYQLNKSRNES